MVCFLMLLFFCSWNGRAQGPNEGFVMEAEGIQHLLPHADPMYPPIAQAEHVQGTVLLHVTVDVTGKVTAVPFLSAFLPPRRRVIRRSVRHSSPRRTNAALPMLPEGGRRRRRFVVMLWP